MCGTIHVHAGSEVNVFGAGFAKAGSEEQE